MIIIRNPKRHRKFIYFSQRCSLVVHLKKYVLAQSGKARHALVGYARYQTYTKLTIIREEKNAVVVYLLIRITCFTPFFYFTRLDIYWRHNLESIKSGVLSSPL